MAESKGMIGRCWSEAISSSSLAMISGSLPTTSGTPIGQCRRAIAAPRCARFKSSDHRARWWR